ncbi:MAG TPA: hypothetical protein VF013_08715 [Candidatus Limnocylindria bacterium]
MEGPVDLAALRSLASGLDAEWLAGRRWFGARTRRLAGVELADAASLDDGAWLLVLAAHFDDGGTERYLVPAMAHGGALREPGDGEGAWAALTHCAARGGDLASARGRFTMSPTPRLAELLPPQVSASSLAERRFAGEQSNTSVRLGDRVVLKLYRHLVAGINPEIEVNRFLSDAGFPHAPGFAGCVEYVSDDEAPCAAALLQAMVPARGDGWTWAVSTLSRPPDGPQELLAAASVIGGVTAQLHEALASRPDDEAFPARPATDDERRAWQAAAERGLEAAVAVLPPDGEEHGRLEAIAPALGERLAAIGAAAGARLSRIHGDYHLGQLLRTENGFVVIDFEGEPARPLAERRTPASPLRDVAGMLRSFDYAARTAERGVKADGDGRLEVDAWLADARAAFLTAYAGDAVDRELLAALEVEKACYEVRYEANHRPDWIWLPLEALERAAGERAA